jgi:hypothetical protein
MFWGVKAVFVELPAFERHRTEYFDDDAFRELQDLLMLHPEAGDLIPGTGGLRKVRFADKRRGKGNVVDSESSITGGTPVRSSGYLQFTTKTRYRISLRPNASRSRR